MRIVSFKPGHDGTIASLHDRVLEYCIEAEKDSAARHAELTPETVPEALDQTSGAPDVVCVSGWSKSFRRPIGAGYLGWDTSHTQVSQRRLFGGPVSWFSSTHERSHLLSAYGMSPYPKGEPCYALVWEGIIGAFHEITKDVEVIRIAHAMDNPGHKYQYVFALADPTTTAERGGFRFPKCRKIDDAGRVCGRIAGEPG